MRDFMITLLICSVTVSALALLYMAIMPMLEKRYSAKGRYYAWLIIVIGLIIPFRPQFDNAIVKVDMPSESVVPIIQIGNGTPITITPPVPVPNLTENTATSLAFPNISWWQITVALWLLGMIIYLIHHIIKHYRFIKLVARWSENITNEQSLTLFQSLKMEMGISKHMDLKLCTSIGSPMMIGFVNPKVLLPKEDFAQDELRLILKHELIHYKRKDLWYKCLVMIATAIHWFNPIIHLMTRTINILCELSCDDEVVLSMDIDTRQLYSETIIGVVRHQSKLITALSTNFYGGKKGMKKRIFSIMDTRKKRAGFAIICAVLLVVLGTGFAFAYAGSAESLMTAAGYVENGKVVVFDSANDKISFDTTDHITGSLEEYNNTQFPLMAAISEQDIWLYGLKPRGVVLVKGNVAQYFDWDYLTPEGIFPQLSFADFGHDNRQEIGVILSIGSGTGVSIDELHIVAIYNSITGKAILEDNVFREEDYLKQLDELLRYTIDPNANSIILHIQNEDISVPCELDVESIFLGNFVSFEINGNNIKALFAIGTIYENMVSPQYEIGLLICDVAYNNGKYTLQNPILDTTNTVP